MFSHAKLGHSVQQLVDAAVNRAVEVKLTSDPHMVLMSREGKSWFARGSRTSIQSAIGKSIADEKDTAKLVLTENNIPTSDYRIVDRSNISTEQLEGLNFPVVLKPVQGAYGDNVFVNLKDKHSVVKAMEQAMYRGRWLVEEQLEGKFEYRIVCVDYKFVAAAIRIPPFVIGDGQSTIGQLIEAKNSQPFRSIGIDSSWMEIKLDQNLINYITEQGFSLESTPEADHRIQLRGIVNMSVGGEAKDVTDQVCQENIEMFEEISRACDLNVIGIDIKADNLSHPLSQQPKSGVIEINTSPGLSIHQYPLEPEKNKDIAGKVIDMTLKHFGFEVDR